ncbi:hypothetical protein LTR70_003969 [Exophiala xenobiotica]|uniref:Haloacid dehalogenase n=1 Tax=Lithohypha guttulata TaxID=1690604 RepID=A0ABR0K9C6_9EURO|nr:hypothetical protein LTR24_005267 [Lithohypha guttulata]KAK5322122.1 hypothetical protein LTR70_003969 [Exophiala xenobiotica]
MSLTNPPKALLTDVFGTVVDWRSTVTDHLVKTADETLNSPAASIPSAVRTAAASVDWGDLAAQWRRSYYHFTRSYDPSQGGFKSVDQHHLEALIRLLRDNNLEGLWDEQELTETSMIWHFLDPWPDSADGLNMLNQKFETATLSNGNTSLLTDLAEYAKLPYKHIVSAEEFKAYKPHPNVYNGAAKRLGLEPSQCALIAAHLGDLEASKRCGYQTIYIERAQEEGWETEKVEQAKKEGWVDMWVSIDEGGFEEVARRFGCTHAEKGMYHETGGITGTTSHPPTGQVDKSSTEQQAKAGTFHEDLSITEP